MVVVDDDDNFFSFNDASTDGVGAFTGWIGKGGKGRIAEELTFLFVSLTGISS